MPRPRLVLTVDVEEDMPGWEITDPITVANVSALPRLAKLCAELDVLPTYLCNHAVVSNPTSARVLRSLRENGHCEVGTHLHPWNTPPFAGLPGRAVDERTVPSYPFELGADRFRAKLHRLHDALCELIGCPPVSFRAGRFGIDAAIMGVLVELGYEVDTSILPLVNRLDEGGPNFCSAPQLPYRPNANDVTARGDLPIVEIPVSVALTRRLPGPLREAYARLPRWTRLRGLLSREYLGWVDCAWLYPVDFDLAQMRAAARSLCALDSPVLNVFLHSSELHPGASGGVQTEADVEACFERLREILEFCLGDLTAVPMTLGDAGRELRPSLGLAGPAPQADPR